MIKQERNNHSDEKVMRSVAMVARGGLWVVRVILRCVVNTMRGATSLAQSVIILGMGVSRNTGHIRDDKYVVARRSQH